MLPPMLATARNAASGCKARLRWAWPLPLVWRCHSYQAWPPANAPRPWAQRTSALVPGVTKVVEWRGKPVWLLKRTPEQLADLEKINGLADPASVKSVQPEYARNTHRSIKPELLVAVGICTHLGCSPSHMVKGSNNPSVPADWPGGFFCPCHGSTFDLAGRVFLNKPAPTNLDIPPHMYTGDTTLVIGEDANGIPA